MDINTLFSFFYHQPDFMIYISDERVVFFCRGKSEWQTIQIFEDKSIYELDQNDFQPLIKTNQNKELGLVLNSTNFIFNFFDFDKLPVSTKMCHDLVEWRLKKVFPDNLENYDNRYYKLGKSNIFSVLYKKESLERLEKHFSNLGFSVVFLGNSTLNILKHIKKIKNSLDFIIERDGHLITLVFLKNRRPYYLRKFRCDNDAHGFNEIVKTIDFVKSNYQMNPLHFAFISILDEDTTLVDELIKNEYQPIKDKINTYFILPK